MNPNDGPVEAAAYAGGKGITATAMATGDSVATAPGVNTRKITSSVTNGTKSQTGGLFKTGESGNNPYTIYSADYKTVTTSYTPDTGKTLDKITIDGTEYTPDSFSSASTLSGTGYTVTLNNNGSLDVVFANLSADHAVSAVFKNGLSVTKSADAATKVAGDDVTYTITITNGTASAVSGLKIVDTLNSNLTYKSSSDSGSHSSGTVTWTGLSVAANSTKSVTVTATINKKLTVATDITNTATLKNSSDEELSKTPENKITANPRTITVKYNYTGTVPKGATTPTDGSENYGTAYTAATQTKVAGWNFSGWYTESTITNAYVDGTTLTEENFTALGSGNELNLYGKWTYGVTLAKVADKTAAVAGEAVTYTITVSNSSDLAVTGFNVTDVLDSNLDCVSATTTATAGTVGYTESTRTVAATGLTIPANGSVTITINTTVNKKLTAVTVIGNTATGQETKDDPSDPEPPTVTPPTPPEITASPRTITIKYNYTGTVPKGASAPADGSENYGTAYTSATQTKVAGWNFSGWYTESTISNAYVDGTELKEENFSALNSGNEVNLYGKWTYGVTLTKTADKTAAIGGEAVTYTITVNNSSDIAVTKYNVTDVLDTNLNYISATTTSTTKSIGFTENTRTLAVTNLTIPANGSITITINTTVNKKLTAVTVIGNTATGQETKDDPSDPEPPIITPPTPPEITASPRTITIKYNYTGTVPKGATAPVDGSEDYGTAYTSATQTKVAGWNFSGWYTESTITNAYVDGTELTEENFAALATGDEVNLYGKWTYGISLTKTADKTDAVGGEAVKYTITVSNSSDLAVTGFNVTDVLDENLNCVSATTTATVGTVGYTEATRTVAATNLTIPANESITVTINTTVIRTLSSAVIIGNTATGKETKEDPSDPEPPTVTPPTPPEINASPRLIKVNYAYIGTVPNGATLPNYSEVTYGATYDATVQANVAGWIFDGWHEDSALTTDYTDGTAINETNFPDLVTGEEITLYGSWTYGLTLTKTADETDAKGGDPVVYTITVSNTSVLPVTGFNVTDVLNANLDYVSAVTNSLAGNVSFEAATNTVSATNLTIPANSSITITINTTVNKNLTSVTVIGNTATGQETKDDPSDPEPPIITPPTPPEINASPRLITVKYVYAGIKPNSAVLPSNGEVNYGATYDAAVQTAVPGWNFNGWFTENTVTNAYVDGTVIDETNFTELATDDEITLYGSWTYGLSMTKVADKTSAKGGEAVKYTITVNNSSSNDVVDYTVIDVLSENLDYVSSATTSAVGTVSFESDTNTVTATGLTIPANGSITVTIETTVNKSLVTVTVIDNTATGKEKKEDPNDPEPPTINPPAPPQIVGSPRIINIKYHYTETDNPTDLPDDDTVNYGEPYTTVPEDEEYYIFEGWYIDEECTTLFVDGTPVTSTIVPDDTLDLYGKWTRKKVQIIYEEPTEGPNITYPEDEIINQGDKVDPETMNDPDDEYIFEGWFTDPEYENPFENPILDDTTAPNGEIHLYPKWKKKIKVQYNFTGNVPEGIHVPEGVKLEPGTTLTTEDISNPGEYTFEGWFIDPECTIRYVEGSAISTDMQLYGLWVREVAPPTGEGDASLIWLAVIAIVVFGALFSFSRKKKTYNK